MVLIEKFLDKKYLNILAILSVLLFVFIIGIYFYNFFGKLSSDQSVWANFGSYMGGTLSATFAFLSFSILLLTLYLQKNELSIAIESLQKSANFQELQKFETTFYSLLDLHNESLKQLSLDEGYINSLLSSSPILESSEFNQTFLEEKLRLSQDKILADVKLSQYFRILYQVLKFIAKNNVKNIEKQFNSCYLGADNVNEEEKMFASILRSFVPVDLLPVLAINCIPTDGGIHKLGEYQSLLERYEFLEHIRFDRMQDNLATFFILDSYSYAFGDNNGLEDKVNRINAIYFKRFGSSLTEGCCLHSFYNPKPVVKPKFKYQQTPC